MKDTAPLPRPDLSLKVAIWTLAIVAVVWVAQTASEVLAPAVLGLVLGIVGAPVADKLDRSGLPRAFVASIMLLGAMAIVLTLLLSLGPVVVALMDQLPRIQSELQGWLAALRDLTQGLRQISADADTGTGEDMPDVADAIWLAPNIGAQLLIILGTFFFFTLTRGVLYDATGAVRPRLVMAERTVARYFATVTMINAGLGLAVMAVMATLGLPNAPLWGAAAGLLNFLLYLGPMILIAALTVTGMALFDGAWAFAPPLLYLAMNITEAQFVTPALVGQKLDVNPLFVFLAVILGLWLWGPIGAMVALPVLLWVTAMLSLEDA